ncbi:MAG: enoyl-CoA hydratase/isomerase family protein [Chloroflexi bacterium]|nr:enoyl-CoA hydratase/isomerase family protein [Chloroflexota bacterium]
MTTPVHPAQLPSGAGEFEPATPELLYERQGAIAYLTFNRPEARNALTWAMYEGLYDACAWVEKDERVRVLVLRGAGDRAFVAGTDISQFTAFTGPEQALEYERNANRYMSRVETLPKPTIAMLRGYCVGGGAAIAMACDLRLASPDVKFGVPIARTLGNMLSNQNLARMIDLIGPARTKELLFTARFIEAEEGRAIGLFNHVVEPEQIAERTHAVAEQLAANAPLTLRATKESVRRILAARRIEESDDLILMAYMSEDFKEGVASFLEKRAPRWQGR